MYACYVSCPSLETKCLIGKDAAVKIAAVSALPLSRHEISEDCQIVQLDTQAPIKFKCLCKQVCIVVSFMMMIVVA
jgi:hypothetical protein